MTDSVDLAAGPVAMVRVTNGGYSMTLAGYTAYRLPEGDHWLYTADQLNQRPAEDVVERVAVAMAAVSRPNMDPYALTPAPRGASGLMPKWRLFEHLARAALAAIGGKNG